MKQRIDVFAWLRPLLFLLPAEAAHHITLIILKIAHRMGLLKYCVQKPVVDRCQVWGLNFSNRLGLAAGLDKNGDYIDALGALGFGFIEIGTVTPKPQSGNPKPRLFRLKKQRALINRMGFNNKGVAYCVERLRARQYSGVLGVNIGKNKSTPNDKAVEDYCTCFQQVYPYCDYVTVNVSSPNTPDLRDLQHKQDLSALLKALKQQQQQLTQSTGRYVPLLLKIAPDLNATQIEEIAEVVLSLKIDGVIATNTTLARPQLESEPLSKQAGGLSGAPLQPYADDVLDQLNHHLGSRVPVMAVGGVLDGAAAKAKRQCGAVLVAIYTGLIYVGPKLINEGAQALANPE